MHTKNCIRFKRAFLPDIGETVRASGVDCEMNMNNNKIKFSVKYGGLYLGDSERKCEDNANIRSIQMIICSGLLKVRVEFFFCFATLARKFL